MGQDVVKELDQPRRDPRVDATKGGEQRFLEGIPKNEGADSGPKRRTGRVICQLSALVYIKVKGDDGPLLIFVPCLLRKEADEEG
jgi:hypothetical protein